LTDGQYQIGPGPNGEVRSGNLTAEELNVLNTSLAGSIATARLSAEGHTSVDDVGSETVVTFTRGSGESETILKVAGTDLAYSIQSADEAKILFGTIRNLAAKYYQLPFPDGCSDGAKLVQSLYASMQTCSVDADCSYIDEYFEPVDANNPQFITTDDCSMVKPLSVGNLSSINENRQKLIDAIVGVQNACENFYKADCTRSGINFTGGAAPVCQQGVCQANPGASVVSGVH